MTEKQIDWTVRIGSVITATIVSLIIAPPVINPNSGVIWTRVFVFFAGFTSIILFDKFKNNDHLKRYAIGLVVALMVQIAAYEFVISKFSISCFNKVRVITSTAPFKTEILSEYNAWQLQSQTPLKSLIESHDCSSNEIWNFQDLAFRSFQHIGILSLEFHVDKLSRPLL